jgi:undecaprenyl diphosphate synthase
MNYNKDKLEHVAIIMDGNRRWAKTHNQDSKFGHQTGLENIQNIIKHILKHGIKYLTLFAFSTENLNRNKNEIEFLFKLFQNAVIQYEEFLIENKISFRIIGDLKIVDKQLQDGVNNLIDKTEIENPRCTLILAFNYSGRQEIINATKQIAKKAKCDEIDIDFMNEDVFKKNMQSNYIPDPDILIRTGGELRISNFLLWQLSYTELYFTQINWPDFSEQDLEDAVNDFYKRKRNFGK